MKKTLIILFIITLLISCCSCQPKECSLTFYAMDTVMELRLLTDDEALLSLCRNEITRLEELFSFAIPSTDIALINSRTSPAVTVQAETAELIRIANEISAETDGYFDITVFPLVQAWGFDGIAPHVPSADEITIALGKVGYGSVTVNGSTVTLADGQMLDTGAITKGYASDRLAQICRASNVNGIISLGGNVMAIGTRADGTPWRVGIADPKNTQAHIGTVSVSDRAVITAGNYQRFFESNGTLYHHILDPYTGYPTDNGLLSVTVIGVSGITADAYSTALFAMGTEKATDFLANRPDLSVIMVTNDRVYVTSDLKDVFKSETALPVTYIR